MEKFKRYKSVFGESTEAKPAEKKTVKQEGISKAIRKALKESDMPMDQIDKIVDKIEDVITDVIDSHGVDNTVVDALANTVKDINGQNAIIDDISMFEGKLKEAYTSVFKEAEEDEEEMEESTETEGNSTVIKEEEEDDSEEEDEDDEDSSMKEKIAKRDKTIAEMRAKLKAKAFKEEGDDEDEEDDIDMEEAINGFKTKGSAFSEEDNAGEEGDFLNDDGETDYEALSLDDMGNAPSDRDMDADMDDNSSQDGA